MKKYYITAFESDTSEVNYLRAVLNGFDKAEDRKNLSRAMEKFELKKAPSGILGRVDQVQKELKISRAETPFYLSCFWMDNLTKF